MKKHCIALFLLISFYGTAQRVDLDRFSFPYSVLKLPTQYIEPEKRTYGASVKIDAGFGGGVSSDELYNKVLINGFRKIEDKPTIGVRLFVNSFTMGDVIVKPISHEERDKDGKVIRTTYTFVATATSNFTGSYHYVEQMTPEEQAKAVQEATEKAKKEAEAKKEAMAKAASTNRFLQNVQVKESKSEETTDVSVSAERVIKNHYTHSLPYSSSEFSTEKAAYDAYNSGREVIRQKHLADHVSTFSNGVNNALGNRYGFRGHGGTDFLWILDSKKHPEYEVQQEAIKAVKTLMATMSATALVDDLTKNVEPLLEYFESLKTKYTSDEKADKKMRYSAYYNLSKIYQYLDQHDKAIEQANGLIKNDFDPKDGESLIEESEKIKAQLANQKMATRHMIFK